VYHAGLDDGVASAKVGYAPPHRVYQIQSGLANAATAVTALLVYLRFIQDAEDYARAGKGTIRD